MSEPERYHGTLATRFPKYELPKTSHRAHLVREIYIVWRGADASYELPRLSVRWWCKATPCHRRELRLSRTPDGRPECIRCLLKIVRIGNNAATVKDSESRWKLI